MFGTHFTRVLALAAWVPADVCEDTFFPPLCSIPHCTTCRFLCLPHVYVACGGVALRDSTDGGQDRLIL